MLIQDTNGLRRLVEIKNAPPSSVEDQSGRNQFNADVMIEQQKKMVRS